MVHIEERGGKMTITAYPSELNFFLNTSKYSKYNDDAMIRFNAFFPFVEPKAHMDIYNAYLGRYECTDQEDTISRQDFLRIFFEVQENNLNDHEVIDCRGMTFDHVLQYMINSLGMRDKQIKVRHHSSVTIVYVEDNTGIAIAINKEKKWFKAVLIDNINMKEMMKKPSVVATDTATTDTAADDAATTNVLYRFAWKSIPVHI